MGILEANFAVYGTTESMDNKLDIDGLTHWPLGDLNVILKM